MAKLISKTYGDALFSLAVEENKIDEFTAGGAITDANASMMAESIKYATIIVSVIPILCVYPFIQKYFTKGVMVGAVKG